jgi:hypothetical protein
MSSTVCATFSGAAYSLGVSDNWSPGGMWTANEPEWTIIHEMGHRVNYFVGSKIDNDMYDAFYDGTNASMPTSRSNPSSTIYPEREYFAETFALYILTAPANTGEWIPRNWYNDLDTIYRRDRKAQIPRNRLDQYFWRKVIRKISDSADKPPK